MVEARKLEHDFRSISARIPYTLPRGHEDNDVPTFWLLLYLLSRERVQVTCAGGRYRARGGGVLLDKKPTQGLGLLGFRPRGL